VKLTFLGTGTSFGVPQLGCGCAVCRSEDPRDHRSRVGAVVEGEDGARILIDTPPELRLQLLRSGIARVDAVLFTHEHADHTHGLDDVRGLAGDYAVPLPCYGPAETLQVLQDRFGYVFDRTVRVIPGTSKPEAEARALTSGVTTMIAGMAVTPIEVPHGRVRVFGYRIGGLGYITDAKLLPDEAIGQLQGVEVLVLNALFRDPHPTHLSISEAIAVAERVGAGRTYFTHLTHQHRHVDLAAALPAGIAPAFDGLEVELGVAG
jgi:phosphoribosyl 1,2-cyclic phosphate phosphodiesterase